MSGSEVAGNGSGTSVGSDPSGVVPAPGRAHRRRGGSSRLRRAVYALVFLFLVLLIGTLGFHAVAQLGWVDSFYFESMLATGQGPPLPLTTDASKIYASIMAFVSIGSVLTTIVFTLGPMVARLWHEAAERVEAEGRRFEQELRLDRRSK